MKTILDMIQKTEVRMPGFITILGLIMTRGSKTFVETGTTRKLSWNGDGCSTIIFAEIAKKVGGHLHTIDISKDNIEFCKSVTIDYSNITYVAGDSLNFFRNDAPKKIDFLYLDSYDWHKTDKNQQAVAQLHNFAEYILAEPFLHKDSILAIDDAGGSLQEPWGKPAWTVKWLIDKGWKCIFYQNMTIFTRDNI